MEFLKSLFSLSSFLLFSTVTIFSCKSGADSKPVQIEHLENELFAAKSEKDVLALIQKNTFLRLYFTDSTGSSMDEAIAAQLYANVSNKELKAFKNELQTYFGQMADIEQELNEAFSNIQKNYPDFKRPRVVTLITGFLGRDLYVSDTLVVVGLDFFGGPKARFRPNDLFNYQLMRYDKPYIIPQILLTMATKYNKKNSQDLTLLADMVHDGKSYEFVKHIAPNTADSLIIGYSQTQLDDVYASQEDVWGYFLDRKLLFQTRDSEKQKFIGERPITVEISQYCPGRIASWVGWRIVSRYLKENPKTSLTELMRNTKSQQILADSRYKGELDVEE
jgi:hypothetical protein